MAETLENKTHVWEGLTEYALNNSDDIFNLVEGGLEGTYEILKKMNKNQYLVVETLPIEVKNTDKFSKVMDELKNYGLDIGRGDCEYGYKMPLPSKGDDRRKLIVFKRK